jgi:hypothetical protein
MKSILHPYEMRTTHMIKCTISFVVGLLHLLINVCMRELFEHHLNYHDWFSFGCCLLSRSTLLISSTKHLN